MHNMMVIPPPHPTPTLHPPLQSKPRKIGFVNMSLAAAVLSGLNPMVVVAAALFWKLWTSCKFLPRGCRVNPEVSYGATAVRYRPSVKKRTNCFETERFFWLVILFEKICVLHQLHYESC